MSPFRFYAPPAYLRLFDVNADTDLSHLSKKKNDLMGGDSDERFKETNPKTYVEIMTAWSLITDPETRPHQLLGASKNINFEDLNHLFCRFVSQFPLLRFPECNHKISKAYALLTNPERRLLIDFFTFEDSVWELYLLDCDDEIAVRRTIEREFSGSISKQIVNSTLFCYLKACQIEDSKDDWELARPYWEKAYLGWQGIFQEAFIWEEMRSRVVSSKLFPPFHAQRFDEESLERIRIELKDILIQNALECARRACGYSILATPHHLKFLKYFPLEQESYRTEAARVYNQCAFLLSRDNRLEEARSLLEEALSLDPDLTQIKTNLELAKTATSGMGQALRLLYQNKEKDALELLQKILHENPQDNDAKELFVTLLHKLAHDCSRSGNFHDACVYLSESCKIRSDYKQELDVATKARQKSLLAQVAQYLQNEEYEQVIRILEDYINKYPEQEPPKSLLVRVLNRMSIIKNRQHLWTEARDLIREAIKLEPDNETLMSNLARVDQAAENQQIANELASAARLINEGRHKDAIEKLQPIYQEQRLPAAIVEEMRTLLASAYFNLGMAMIREAENAASRGAIREAFRNAHKCLSISCFLDDGETTRAQIVKIEETLPELVDEQYDPSIFPQPPGGKRRPLVQKKYYRLWRKFRIKLRILRESAPRIPQSPVFIPVTFLPLFLISYFVVKALGPGILSAFILALLAQAALSAFIHSKTNPEKKKLLLKISAAFLFLVLVDFLWIAVYQQKLPVFPRAGKSGEPKPVIVPKPAPTQTREEPSQSVIDETPPPTIEEPLPAEPVVEPTPERSPAQTPSVAPVETAKPKPIASSTPAQTPVPKATPALEGTIIETPFIIQELVGVRQSPAPSFVYRITTNDGLATLIIDPLTYIKIPKDRLIPGENIRAKLKVISVSDISVYSIESPRDLLLD